MEWYSVLYSLRKGQTMTHAENQPAKSWHTVDECVAKHTCGMVSGYKAQHSDEQNKTLTQTLIDELKNKSYSVAKIDGSYTNCDYAAEHQITLFVVNQKVSGDDGGQLLTDLIATAQQHDIESVLSIKNAVPEVIKVKPDTDTKLKFGEKKYIGTPHFGKAVGDITYTVNGKPFGFGHQPKE